MLINNKIELSLAAKKYITPRSIELSYQSDLPLKFLSGQFYSIEFSHQGETKVRSYSAANPALVDNDRLTFVITLVPEGAASEYFRDTAVGDKVSATGPFGNLILPRILPKRLILIATGAGVTPFRSMLPLLQENISENAGLEVLLMQGVRNREELLYADEFIEVATQFETFQFKACYSRENSESLKPFESHGYVSDHYRILEVNPDNDMIYVCGHPEMIDQAVVHFEQKGFTPANLKREKYLFSAL